MSNTPEGLAPEVWLIAARVGHLEAPRCPRCRSWAWPPAPHCRSCGAETAWERVATAGTIHAISVVHRPVGKGSEPTGDDIVVAFVDIDGGPRILTRVIGDAATATAIGDRVNIDLGQLNHDGPMLPLARTSA